jgi:hypothetical protein
MIEDDSVDGGLFSTETRYEPNTSLSQYLNYPIVGAGGFRLFELTGDVVG